ncbi:unnamed protein product [Macrosiphum euphorbiae]|uniref:CCHC-type domain-containing protein n=1 Tax=Macrosiphum euphorbiae TaxID=13131 RepID=A0AAV0WBT1_9HEMI|nr:unnamed protein product [Macrosiphum euphorbiae]
MVLAKRSQKNDGTKQKEMYPCSRPPRIRGGGGHPEQTTGNLEPGKVDDEDTNKLDVAVLEKEMNDADDITLSGWTWEVWTGIDDDLNKMDVLVSRLYAFTSQTRNVHKEVKAMSSELIDLMKNAKRRSQELGIIADKTYERVKDLTIQNTSLNATIATSEEKVVEKTIQEERGNVPERKKKKSKMKPGNKKTHVAPSQGVTISKGKGASTYANMVKKLKDEIDLETIGVEIKSMKRTKEDGIFMFVGKGTKAAEDVKKLKREVENVLGGDVVVKESSRPPLIEIRGIGQEEKEEDVVSGICRYGAIPEEVHVTKMVPSFGATQRALVSVSAEIAGKIIATGRVLVGLISCGVRMKGNPVIRCYRCHGYNHKASTCRGPDRRKLCMTCGGEDHLAKLCRSAPNCVLCKDINRQADHYPGSGRCEAYRKARLK